MQIENILAVGLAAGYCILAWRDGSIFLNIIAWLEDQMLGEHLRRKFGATGKGFGDKLTELLLCPLCLAPWVCLLIWHSMSLLLAVRVSRIDLLVSAFASAAIAWATYKTLTLKAKH